MRLFLIVPFLATAGYSTATAQQVGRGLTAPTNLEYISQQMSKGKSQTGVANAKGSPMVIPYWTRGRVQTINGPIEAVWLKYDIAHNELLWRRPSGDSLELNTSQITEFTLGDSLRANRTTYRRYLDARIEDLHLRTAFFEVCYDAGRSALLRQRSKQLAGPGGGSPSLTESRPAAWQESSFYYIRRADNKVLPVRLNRKSVVEALGTTHAPEVTAFVQRERLALKKTDEVAKLLAYYDTL